MKSLDFLFPAKGQIDVCESSIPILGKRQDVFSVLFVWKEIK